MSVTSYRWFNQVISHCCLQRPERSLPHILKGQCSCDGFIHTLVHTHREEEHIGYSYHPHNQSNGFTHRSDAVSDHGRHHQHHPHWPYKCHKSTAAINILQSNLRWKQCLESLSSVRPFLTLT